jgi:outer membrane protein OmpA-like peptidoglycan-associated protein
LQCVEGAACVGFGALNQDFSCNFRRRIMVDRSKCKVGLVLAIIFALVLGATGLYAQSAAPNASSLSRWDLYAGFSYLGTHSKVQPAGLNYSSINTGGILGGSYWLNNHYGAQGEIYIAPNGRNDGIYSLMVGPAVRLREQNFTGFLHVLGGASDLAGPNSDVTATYEHEPYTFGPALVAGGGMDYDIPGVSNRISFRLFQADYLASWQSFGTSSTIPTTGTLGGHATVNAIRLSTGVVVHFGSIVPPPPVTYACSASPATVFPGDPVTVTGTATNLNPKKTAMYSWTSDAVKVGGASTTANVDTATLAPGTYTVKGHVTEGVKAGQSADCATSFTVKPYDPPTISCAASPSSVNPGDSAAITASAVSPQNRPLTYSYSTSAGTVAGTGSTATLNTAGAAPGTITVTCNAVDDKANAVSATTSVTVIAPPPPPSPKTQALCSISFTKDKARPTRVDNEAKACLDDVSLALGRSADAKVAVVGSSDPKEKKNATKLAADRAENAKAYLVKEKGIDASRISAYTDGTDGKTVATTLIPAGATLDTTGLTAVDESKPMAPAKKPAKKAAAPAAK